MLGFYLVRTQAIFANQVLRGAGMCDSGSSLRNRQHCGGSSGPADGSGLAQFHYRMISKSNTSVAPVYLDAHSSRMLQIASYLHANLRLGLPIRALRNRVDRPVPVVIEDTTPKA